MGFSQAGSSKALDIPSGAPSFQPVPSTQQKGHSESSAVHLSWFLLTASSLQKLPRDGSIGIVPPNLLSQQLFQDVGCFLPLSPWLWLWMSSHKKCFDFCSILSVQSFAESSSADSLSLELLLIIIFFKLCQLLSVALDLHDVVNLLCASQPFVHSQCFLLKCNPNLS